MEKTNVMRILDHAKVEYKTHFYESDGAIAGVEVARIIGKDENCVFKTLVTVGKSGANYVFVIPVAEELDLKKAASHVGEKSIEMLKSKKSSSHHRLCPRRMFAYRYEKAVCNNR